MQFLNRTKIEWTDYSWNPITGCKHECWYCYAKKIAQRFKKIFPNGFEPTFHPERLKEPYELKKPSKIFVCSIADLFAPWTDEGWTNTVLASMLECPIKHTFQMLTKNPERIMQNWILHRLNADTTKFIPKNWWFGTTVTGENNDWKNIEEIKKVNAKVRFVSFEPLLGLIPGKICLNGLQWIIIGKLTGSKKVKLDNYWVWSILNEARNHNIPVFIKNNVGGFDKIQEFPQ